MDGTISDRYEEWTKTSDPDLLTEFRTRNSNHGPLGKHGPKLRTKIMDLRLVHIRTQMVTFNFGPIYEPDRNLESSFYGKKRF